MGNAYLYRMPSGIPGDVTRKSQSTIESLPMGATQFDGFGLFGKIAGGKVVPLATGDAATVVRGLLVRSFPTQSTNNSMGSSTPKTGGVCDFLRRGYMTVKNNAGTTALDGQVYVRIDNAASGKPIGGIEAVADGSNTIVIAGARFMHEADAQGNVEIAFNI